MGKTLFLIESPGKLRKIQQFLGPQFLVLASVGHILDIHKSGFGFNTKLLNSDFEIEYFPSIGKQKVISKIKAAYRKCDDIIIATDNDSEGVAIGHHILKILNLNYKQIKRAVYNEITEKAIKKSIENPSRLSLNTYRKQQARRITDRIVGYKLSPLVRKHVVNATSAGRCQSCCLSIICARNKEVNKFKSSINSKINLNLKNKFDGLKAVGKPNIEIDDNTCSSWANSEFTILSVSEPRKIIRRPPPAFTTAKILQIASMNPKKLMGILQKLYQDGKITYHRTDSILLSGKFVGAAGKFVEKNYGKQMVQKRFYKNSKKSNVQAAHEAIRPVNINLNLENINNSIYTMIRKRALATQMKDAEIMSITLKIKVRNLGIASITFQRIIEPGFLKLYGETAEDNGLFDFVRKLQPGSKFNDVKSVEIVQNLSKPAKTNFSEASIIAELERVGVGRPSTYANILETLLKRHYISIKSSSGDDVELVDQTCKVGTNKVKIKNKIVKSNSYKNKVLPTKTGIDVDEYLKDKFQEITSSEFTSTMEQNLDKIGEGELHWRDEIRSIWNLLEPRILIEKKKKRETIKKEPFEHEPGTNLPIYKYLGRFGNVIRLGDGKQAKYASIPKALELENVKLEDAMFLLSLPKLIKSSTPKITLKLGRYGFYIEKDPLTLVGKPSTRSIGTYSQAKNLTVNTCLVILSKPPPYRKKFKKYKKKK
jgi:DNA topoisomerase I